MSTAREQNLANAPDLSACEQEPIHIPGAIEPSGALLAVAEPDLRIVQASANTGGVLGVSADELLGADLAELIDVESVESLRRRILTADISGKRRYLSGVRVRARQNTFSAAVHRAGSTLVLEFEEALADADKPAGAELHVLLGDAMAELDGRLSLVEICRRVSAYVRRLTGFDRVMLYRFLPDDSGEVIAEERREDLVPYLGLRYPASDIPPQARRLYLLNTLRLKADVGAAAVPLVPPVNPIDGQPLDMSHCVLRSMSQVHTEYLRNMGVSASMSVSVVLDGQLWGLIACHHMTPRAVPQSVRVACEVLARVFSTRIAAAEEEDRRTNAAGLRQYGRALEARLRQEHDASGTLTREGDRLLTAIRACGAAIRIGGETTLLGATPDPDQVDHLIGWLGTKQDGYLFSSERLQDEYPPANAFRQTASGLLSSRIAMGSDEFVLWFRPPAIKVVEWGGDPAKPVEETESGRRVSPRLSFERWKETVGDHSEAWEDYECEFALSLRQTAAEVLLVQKHEQVAHLNLELERSNIELDAFAYAASHDLQEPVRTIRAYTQLLNRRFGGKLDEDARALLRVIEDGTARMASLISALLTYAQVGGSARRERKAVNLDDVLRWVRINLDESLRDSGATLTNDALPCVDADPDQLMQLLQNLIANSIKYRKPNEAPQVHVSAALKHQHWHIAVRDNGEGFEPQQAELIFAAFKRLHGRDIPGTGVGLALCRRIVEHHRGRIWAESEGKGHGATFWFTLPRS